MFPRKALFSSVRHDWRTPTALYATLDKTFHFDFDPCPSKPGFNGLSVPWKSRNFLNPPYGPEIPRWLAKALQEARRGKIVVALVPSRTDTAWWHDYAMKAHAIWFVRGRLKFDDQPSSAPFPSAIVIFDRHRLRAPSLGSLVLRPPLTMTQPNIEEKLRKLASVGGRRAELAWLFYLAGDDHERRETDSLLDVLLFQTLQKDFRERIFLDPPPPSECVGEYRLGTVLYPPGRDFGPFGLREDEWIKHIMISGMTGTGKTNLTFQVLRELQRHRKPFLVLDWKRNYRDLRQLPELANTLVFTVARGVSPLTFNPLIPPPGTRSWLESRRRFTRAHT